jgi:hypothetical protein
MNKPISLGRRWRIRPLVVSALGVAGDPIGLQQPCVDPPRRSGQDDDRIAPWESGSARGAEAD